MKKNLILAFAIVCLLAVPVQAQIQFGVKTGMNLSKFHVPSGLNNFDSDNTAGFFVGPTVDFRIPLVGLGAEISAMYAQRGKDEWKQRGLDIPVHLKYSVGMGTLASIFFFAGPDLFFNFSDIKEADWSLRKRDAQFGLDLGLGLRLARHFQCSLGYQFPLGNSFKLKDAIDTAKDSKNQIKSWQLSVAYMF